MGWKGEEDLIGDVGFLFVELCLFNDDVCCKSKFKWYVVVDIDVVVFFFVLMILRKLKLNFV